MQKSLSWLRRQQKSCFDSSSNLSLVGGSWLVAPSRKTWTRLDSNLAPLRNNLRLHFGEIGPTLINISIGTRWHLEVHQRYRELTMSQPLRVIQKFWSCQINPHSMQCINYFRESKTVFNISKHPCEHFVPISQSIVSQFRPDLGPHLYKTFHELALLLWK